MLTSPNIAVRKFCSAAKVVFTEAHVPPCASAHLCLPINWDIAPASFAMASYTHDTITGTMCESQYHHRAPQGCPACLQTSTRVRRISGCFCITRFSACSPCAA